jgi:mannan endo-1,4-beta-mannosidase
MAIFCGSWLMPAFPGAAFSQQPSTAPVTKNASPEARALLKFFYSIAGEYLLTGQHNFPNIKDRNTQFAADLTGKTPVVFSTDWGFAQDGNTDSYLARQDIVNEAIRQHKLGSIITICWHAVPPTADEPVTFQPVPGADSAKLHSVQGKLLDGQFRDVLTPGTALYRHWAQQVDSIAVYLKKLQDAHVPVIWRPYHEMNGDWFWWGGRVGAYSTVRLYRQLFDRLVNVHHLNNLIWMWNVDRPSTPIRKFSNFYVGNDVFDIASLDVYGSDFKQAYYDSLLALAKGKPVTFGEVGNPPSPAIIRLQPKWSYYVIWAGMARNTSRKEYEALMSDSHVLFLEDSAYWNAIAPYRAAIGLPSLYDSKKETADFSGKWSFSEAKSHIASRGFPGSPALLEVKQHGNEIMIRKTTISEFSDPSVNEQQFALDGTEKTVKAPFGNGAMLVHAQLSNNKDTLFIGSTMTRGNGVFSNQESWALQHHGQILTILQSSSAGNQENVLVFEKQQL